MGIEDCDVLNVETEIGSSESHIDIALYKKNDKFIIIENKANWAAEQTNQVWRYVREIAEKRFGYTEKQIWVLYLNPTSCNEPSMESVSKDGKGKDNVITVLGDRFIVKSFAYDIVGWLSKLNFPKEPFLNSAINQYIDYLEQHYETTKEFDGMKKAVNEYLVKVLERSNKDLAGGISAMSDKLKEIQVLCEDIDNLREKHKELWLKELVERIFNQYKGKVEKIPFFCGNVNGFEDCSPNWPKAGIRVEMKYGKLDILIEYKKHETAVAYGVRMSEKEDNYKEIKEMQVSILTYDGQGPSSTKWWPASRHTSYERAEERVRHLIDRILAWEV